MIAHAILMCMALNIYHEAGGYKEPDLNRYAVGFVTLNRAEQNETSVCKEVYRRKQFSWTNNAFDKDGKMKSSIIPKKSNKMWQRCKAIALNVLRHPYADFTGGAQFFHATYIRPPRWTHYMVKVAVYGHHIFYRKEKYGRRTYASVYKDRLAKLDFPSGQPEYSDAS